MYLDRVAEPGGFYQDPDPTFRKKNWIQIRIRTSRRKNKSESGADLRNTLGSNRILIQPDSEPTEFGTNRIRIPNPALPAFSSPTESGSDVLFHKYPEPDKYFFPQDYKNTFWLVL